MFWRQFLCTKLQKTVFEHNIYDKKNKKDKKYSEKIDWDGRVKCRLLDDQSAANVIVIGIRRWSVVNVDSPVLQQVIFDGVPSCYTAAYVDHFMNIVTWKLI